MQSGSGTPQHHSLQTGHHSQDMGTAVISGQEIEPYPATWIKLMLSEIIWTQKDKCYMISCVTSKIVKYIGTERKGVLGTEGGRERNSVMVKEYKVSVMPHE